MKLQDIKSNQDILDFIDGCLNDFETGVSSKNETITNMVDLIIGLSEKKQKAHKEIPDRIIFEWLKSKSFQTEKGDQEYNMYFDVDMPKIIRIAMQELTP